MNEITTRYLRCWNETDPTARRTLVDELFSADAAYIDPMAEAHGRGAIADTIAAVQAQFDGWEFTPAGAVDGHHNQVRFGWGLGPAGHEPAVIGFDVAVIDDTGRITTVLGFLDKIPA